MKGEVTVRAHCLMPDRLIMRATLSGARFDSVILNGADILTVSCDPPSARILMALCQRFGVPAEVTGRRGASALCQFARSRATLPVGLMLAIMLCLLFLGRIWIIDVTFSGRNAAIGDPAPLLAALNELGMRPGVARDSDIASLSDALRARIGGYSYIGAKLQGIRLLVEAAPEVPAPELYELDKAQDLVAERDGIVVRAVARSGELCVKPGDTVRRGQLLIRGEELSGTDGATRSIAALGEVVLRSWYEGSARLPLAETRTWLTGRSSTDVRVTALGREWVIAPGTVFPSQRSRTEYLPIGGMFLPVEILRTRFEETRRIEERIDEKALKERLSGLALADAALSLQINGPIRYDAVRSWIDYEYEGNTLCARAVREIQAESAVSREALLQGGYTIWKTWNRSIPST